MCLLVDANVGNLILTSTPRSSLALIHEWLFLGKGCLVIGGKLTEELCHSSITRELIKVLNQSGKVRIIQSDALFNIQKRLSGCRSNDTHVLALAIVSRARLLCSADQDLRTDFKNTAIIAKPKGHLYPLNGITKIKHNKIIRRHGCNPTCQYCKTRKQ